MKKKLLLHFGFFIFLTFALTHSCFAESNGAYCSGAKVLLSGSSTNQKQLLLQHQRIDCGEWPANTPKWFSLDNSGNNANAMLAAALTAHATGKTVTVAPNDGKFGANAILVQVFCAF